MKSEQDIVPTTTSEQLAAQEEKIAANKEKSAQIFAELKAQAEQAKEKVRQMKVADAKESADELLALRQRLQQEGLADSGRAERNAAFLRRAQGGSTENTERAA